jgi:U3 small nucleolar RNA-associated protein 20
LPSLSIEPLHTLILLNNLAEAGLLTGSLYNVQGGRWRVALMAALGDLFEKTATSELHDAVNRRVMGQILHLLPSMSSEGANMVVRLLSVIDALIGDTKHSVKAEWEKAGSWNRSHLLAEALQAARSFAYQTEVQETLREGLLQSGQIMDISSRWCWNREVLEVVASLIELWSEDIR